MPSQREMNARLVSLEKNVARVTEDYRRQFDIIQRREEKLRIAQEKLEYEEELRRPGKSGEHIREFRYKCDAWVLNLQLNKVTS